jgi:hypothetical protein
MRLMPYYADTGRSRPPNRLTLRITLLSYPFTTNDQPRSLMLQSYIGSLVYNKGGVSSCGLAIHKFKNILRQKKKKKNILQKLKYFTMQKYNLQKKNSSKKETKILQGIITL